MKRLETIIIGFAVLFCSFVFSSHAYAVLSCDFECPTCEKRDGKMVVYGNKFDFEVTVKGEAGDNPAEGNKSVTLIMGEYATGPINIPNGSIKGTIYDFDTLEASKDNSKQSQDGIFQVTCIVIKMKLKEVLGQTTFPAVVPKGYNSLVKAEVVQGNNTVDHVSFMIDTALKGTDTDHSDSEYSINNLQITESKKVKLKAIAYNSKNKNIGTAEEVVWSVWATITSTDRPFQQLNDPAQFAMTGGFNFTHTIQPNSIFNQTDPDFPNLSGANTVPPPGGNNVLGQPLSGGVNRRWDNSRQIRYTTVISPGMTVNDLGAPIAIHTDVLNFPADDVEGNDDAGTGDETNDPYANIGILTGMDSPTRGVFQSAGNIGDTVSIHMHFREFARLEINGTWYRISDFYPWRIHFEFIKRDENDPNNDGNTNDAQDLNGDGDANDVIWNNNGSVKDLTNNGW